MIIGKGHIMMLKDRILQLEKEAKDREALITTLEDELYEAECLVRDLEGQLDDLEI